MADTLLIKLLGELEINRSTLSVLNGMVSMHKESPVREVGCRIICPLPLV